jgi:hypothetical protein
MIYILKLINICNTMQYTSMVDWIRENMEKKNLNENFLGAGILSDQIGCFILCSGPKKPFFVEASYRLLPQPNYSLFFPPVWSSKVF